MRVQACAALAAALCFFSATSMNVLLPTVAQALGAGPLVAQWALLSYWMAIAACMVALGRLSDIWGRRGVFCTGLAVFALASGLAAICTDAIVFVALRLLQGAAAAAIFANTAALVAHAHAGPRLGTALGSLALVAALAQAAGPSLGASVAQHWGWRSTLLLPAAMAASLALLAWHHLPPAPRPSGARQRFDTPGALWLAIALALLCWSLAQFGQGAFLQGGMVLAAPAGALLACVGVLARLWRRLRAVSDPLVAPELLRDPVAGGVYLGTFIVALVQQGPLVVLALHLQLVAGLSLADSGWRLGGMAVGMVIGAACAGPCTRRWHPQPVCLAAMAWILAALLGTLLCAVNGKLDALVVALAALGFGVALYVTPSNQLLMHDCPPRHRGVVNALRATVQNAGMLTGIGCTMAMTSLALPPALRTAAFTGDASARPWIWQAVALSLALLSAAVLSGLVACWRLWQTRT